MPTEENKTIGASTNPAGSNQTSSSSTQGDGDNLNQSDKIDNLDIDLNLDGLDLPTLEDKGGSSEANNISLGNDQVYSNSELNNVKVGIPNEQNDVKSDSTPPLLNDEVDNKINDEKSFSNDFIINDGPVDQTVVSGTLTMDDVNNNSLNDTNSLLKDDVDINIKKEPLGVENSIIDSGKADNDDNWLMEEDKKVEEVMPVSSDNIAKDNLQEDTKPGLLDEKKVLDTLDIPFVGLIEDTKSNDDKIDDLLDIFGDEDVNNSQNSKEAELEIKNENINLEEAKLEPLMQNNQDTGLLVENLGENVVENNDGDIVSDTGEFAGNNVKYVPNEHDFNQVTEVLNSSAKGQVDLSSLNSNDNNKVGLDLGDRAKVISSQSTNNGIDLDAMISNFDTSKNVVEDLVVNTTVSQEISVDTSVVNSNQANLEVVQPGIDPTTNINSDLSVQPVGPFLNNQQLLNNQVNVISEEEFLEKKHSHSGIKIFALIILLLVGGFMILSKMYPEEIHDIMDAIQNGNQTSIEYSDNADIGVILDETEESLSGDISEEELDPDSLAAQLENGDEDMLGSGIDYSEEDISTQHGSSNDTDLNAFETLDDVIGSDSASLNNDGLLDSLNVYITKGTEFNDWGRSIGNSTAMKYGTYIFTKASAVVNDIENGVEIDNTKVENYFAQFDIYLDKLSNLRNSTEGAVQEEHLSLQPVDESISEQPISTEF